MWHRAGSGKQALESGLGHRAARPTAVDHREFRGQYTYLLDTAIASRYNAPMARLARVVVPGIPHHLTQRGNRRLPTFFSDDDYLAYLDLLAEHAQAAQVAVWAYCLMPNHVHLVLVPSTEDGLRAALGETHRRYTRRVNFREGWRGHLWQERFASFPLDDAHLWPRCGMSSGTRCGRSWWRNRRSGDGAARGRIWRGRMTAS